MSFTKRLIETANRVHDLMLRGARATPHANKSLDQALSLSCVLVGDLLIDYDFARFARQIEEVSIRDSDLGEAIDDFLLVEERLLLAAGLYPPIVAKIIAQCRKSLSSERLANDEEEIDIIGAVDELRIVVCECSERMHQEVKRTVVKKSITIFGGIATAALNGVGIAKTFGLSAPWQAASIGAGKAVAISGLRDIRKALG